MVNGTSSYPTHVISGVLQGSVLGPLLFLIYIDDISTLALSESRKISLYATVAWKGQFYLQSTIHNPQSTIHNLQSTIYIVQCALRSTIHNPHCAMCDRQSTIHIVQRAIDNLQSTLCNVRSTIHVVQSAIDSRRPTMCERQCMHSHGTESEPVMTVE